MKGFKKRKILKITLLVLLLLFLLAVGIVTSYVISKLSLIDYDDGTLKETAGDYIEDVDIPDDGPGVDISGLEEVETFPVIPDTEIQKDKDIINILVLGTDPYDGTLTKYARSD